MSAPPQQTQCVAIRGLLARGNARAACFPASAGSQPHSLFGSFMPGSRDEVMPLRPAPAHPHAARSARRSAGPPSRSSPQRPHPSRRCIRAGSRSTSREPLRSGHKIVAGLDARIEPRERPRLRTVDLLVGPGSVVHEGRNRTAGQCLDIQVAASVRGIEKRQLRSMMASCSFEAGHSRVISTVSGTPSTAPYSAPLPIYAMSIWRSSAGYVPLL